MGVPVKMVESVHRLLRFGVYEMNLDTQELRNADTLVRLSPQPFKLLALLASHAGQIVPREEIQEQIWGEDTYVDFDQGVNKCIKQIRNVLNDNADRPLYVETLPRKGYRFLAPVVSKTVAAPLPKIIESPSDVLGRPTSAVTARLQIVSAAGAASSPAAPSPESAPSFSPLPAEIARDLAELQTRPATTDEDKIRKSRSRPRRVRFVWIAAVALAVPLALLAWHYLRPSRAAQIDAIAVLPFSNAGGDANTDYLSDGITESLIDNLAHVPQLKVKSRRSVFRYKGKDVDVRRVGADLGISALVSGRVMPRGDDIEVSAELINVRDNTEIWGQHYSGKSSEIISLQQQIAGDIAAKLRSQLNSSEKQQVTKQGTKDPEAYELYLKGRYAWNKRTHGDIDTAISYFNQAIAKDPGYALAYSGLADSYFSLASYGGIVSETVARANTAARKALELDPTLAHPHAVLGSLEMEHDWDFAGGEAEFKKALELDPNDATAHQWYAAHIGWIGGREQESIAEAERAHQLDALSPVISFTVGASHLWARQFDEAIVLCQKLASENPAFPPAHACLSDAYWAKRMYPQVIEEWKAFGRLSGDQTQSEFASAAEQGFRSGGWKGALNKGIEAGLAQRKAGNYSAYRMARLYADLGNKEQAFQWLNIAYKERDWLLLDLRTDFVFDPIRSDPRFVELVRNVGLPQ